MQNDGMSKRYNLVKQQSKKAVIRARPRQDQTEAKHKNIHIMSRELQDKVRSEEIKRICEFKI